MAEKLLKRHKSSKTINLMFQTGKIIYMANQYDISDQKYFLLHFNLVYNTKSPSQQKLMACAIQSLDSSGIITKAWIPQSFCSIDAYYIYPYSCTTCIPRTTTLAWRTVVIGRTMHVVKTTPTSPISAATTALVTWPLFVTQTPISRQQSAYAIPDTEAQTVQ